MALIEGKNRGERHSRAKLDPAKVQFIRDHPEINNAELARRFGVTKSTVRLCRSNHTWRDPAYAPVENPFRGSGLKGGGRPEEAAARVGN